MRVLNVGTDGKNGSNVHLKHREIYTNEKGRLILGHKPGYDKKNKILLEFHSFYLVLRWNLFDSPARIVPARSLSAMHNCWERRFLVPNAKKPS